MRGAQPWKTNRAQVLREGSSTAAERMWSALRGRRLCGFKFVREYPIGPYFADFCCRGERLVVEVDGATHSTDEELRDDAVREAYLRAQGYRVFRVHNMEVVENLDGVLHSLLIELRGGDEA